MRSDRLRLREDLGVFERPPPPLKNKNFENRASTRFKWPKLGLEPKSHESGTFGGFGKREQSVSRIFNTGPYGDPP